MRLPKEILSKCTLSSCFVHLHRFMFSFHNLIFFISRVFLSLVNRKNVDDFTGPRERSDLGFITFDLSADILLEYCSEKYILL